MRDLNFQSSFLTLLMFALVAVSSGHGLQASLNAQEVWNTLDRKPSLEVLLARYPVPSRVQAAMRAAVCSTVCQATLRNAQHLQECTILAWEMYPLLGCRAECLDTVAPGCPTLQRGLPPSGMRARTKPCTYKQYRTFFKRYQHGNLGGGLLEDLYETVHNGATTDAPSPGLAGILYLALAGMSRLVTRLSYHPDW